MGLVVDGRAVDVAHARVDVLREVQGLVDVLSEDRRREAVFGVVGLLQTLFVAVDRVDRGHGAKGLGAAHGHLFGHVGEQGGLAAIAFPAAANDNLGALALRVFDVVPDPGALAVGDDRRDHGGRVAQVAHPDLANHHREALDKGVIKRTLDVEPARADARLTGKHEN